MEQFYLIIQKTTTGLTVEYASPGIDPQNPNVIKTLEDERAYSTQIVKESDIYSLQITDHFRIYSLIVTDSDKFGRSGFYEFKLYGPRDYPLENFEAILQEIKKRYNEDISTKPYESILSTILLTQNNSITNYISGKQNNKKYYTFYDETNLDSLKEIFREKGGYLINKLYALNRSKAYKEDVIQSLGLLPFSMGHFREVVISNPDRVLKELFLNNEKLEVNTFKDEFKILIEPKDVLRYSTSDSKTVKTIPGSFAEIKRKPPVYKHVPTNYPPAKKKSFLKENGVYLLALVIMIGGAGFGIYKFFQGSETSEKITISDSSLNNNENNVTHLDSTQITFEETIEGDGILYTTHYKSLNHYTFKYLESKSSNNKWTYINYCGKEEYNAFHREIVKDLKIDKKIVLEEEEEQIEFIAALEKASTQPIPSKIAEKSKLNESPESKDLPIKPVVKKIEETKKQDEKGGLEKLENLSKELNKGN